MNNRNYPNLPFARNLRKSQTYVEYLFWNRVRARQLAGAKFRRQEPIGKYIVDFICFEYKLIIELDGGQHNTDVHSSADEERTQWLKRQGYTVLRFWNNEILENMEGVLEKIVTLILTFSQREKE